jgi:Uma2 family endonuclease
MVQCDAIDAPLSDCKETSMVTTKLFTAADLAAMGSDAPYELIDGELREVSPCFIDSSRIALRISSPLFQVVESADLGVVTGADGGYLLSRPGERETVVAPDIGFIRLERIPRGYDFREFFPGAPDLAVEVVSISDQLGEVADKIRRYLAAGARLVWEVRPLRRTVVVHRPGQAPVELGERAFLDGEDVVPGFRLAIAEIFREPKTR